MQFDEYLSYSEKDQKTIITQSVNFMVKFLNEKLNFPIQKSLQFILFLLSNVIHVSGEYSKEQHNLFHEATGIPYDYETLKNHFLNSYQEGNEDTLLKALYSYDDDQFRTNATLLAIVFISIKGKFLPSEEEFINKLASKVPFEMKTQSSEDLGVDDRTVHMVDQLLGAPIEYREQITLSLIEEIKKKLIDVNEEKVKEVLVDLSSLALRNLSLSNPIDLFNKVKDKIDEDSSYNEEDIDIESLSKFIKQHNIRGEASVYILALCSCSRTISDETMKLAYNIATYE